MPLQQQAGDLGAVEQKVVRPFQQEARSTNSRHGLDSLMQGKPGDEAELWGGGHVARINQKQAGIEIARRRRPLPAVPPPTRQLLGCSDPELPWITVTRSLESIVVRRARRLKREKPIAGGLGLGRQMHDQNKERAAAPAALTIGAGTSQNSSTTALDTTRTKLTPGDMRSNRSTGASKYMTFTIRR